MTSETSNEFSNPDPLLSINRAAVYLGGISTRTVWLKIKQHNIPLIKIGSRTFIKRSSLDAFIRSCEEASQ